MRFVIRDDDLSFFSRPEDIAAGYTEVFSRNIPVSFATIPFISSVGDATTPTPLRADQGDQEWAISGNARLVEYLLHNPLIEIMQHGCTHSIFEYTRQKGLFEATLRGKDELEHTFNRTISVFVAPHDRFSSHAIKAIEHAGLHIIRGKGTKNFLPRFAYAKAIARMVMHRLRFLKLSTAAMPAYPVRINLGRHQEAYGIRIESDFDILLNALRFVSKKNGDFVLVNHLHNFDEEKKNRMLQLIDQAQSLGFTFCFASELFSGRPSVNRRKSAQDTYRTFFSCRKAKSFIV